MSVVPHAIVFTASDVLSRRITRLANACFSDGDKAGSISTGERFTYSGMCVPIEISVIESVDKLNPSSFGESVDFEKLSRSKSPPSSSVPLGLDTQDPVLVFSMIGRETRQTR